MNWAEVHELEKSSPGSAERLLIEQLNEVSQLSDGKDVLYYASGFLQHPNQTQVSITREDMNGFMNAVYGLSCNKGLILIIHTPGGDPNAVESIVEYLHSKFDYIETIVPYLAMSGGSMINLASDKIILGKQSQIGPIDPQIVVNNKFHSARAIKQAFMRASDEIKEDIKSAHLWAPILQSMGPSLILEAEKALDYSQELVSKWLKKRMFKNVQDEKEKERKVKKIAEYFNAEHKGIHMHGQRIDISILKELGIKAEELEKKQELQNAVLIAYHCMTVIFEITSSFKFIINHKNKKWLKQFSLQPPIPNAK